MQKPLLFKTVIIAVLMLLLVVPLMLIKSTVTERMTYRDEAVRSIAADSVREQTLVGPVLVIPYTEEYEEQAQKRTVSKRFLVFPNELLIKGSIDTDRRNRGIHKVLVYAGQYAIEGDFTLPGQDGIPHDKPQSQLTLGTPFLALSIDDIRGIRDIPKMNWGGKQIEFQQGSGLLSFKNGLHAKLGMPDMKEASNIKFSFNLGLDGIERQQFVPVAKNNQVALKSNWPHPQFGGRFLPSPKTRRTDDNGFSATWNISALASNTQQQLTRLEQAQNEANATAVRVAASATDLDRFGVGFIEPVNVYSQMDRAIKYGLLFIALTFTAFFVFEILKELPIHPVQYLLVGLALALFFLLLLSLSEHIDFIRAYLAASTACIALIGFYLAHVLRNWRRSFGFCCALTLLYGALYGLLCSESNALAMGSILLFGVLAALMIATRKVDWYQIGKVKD